MRIEVFFVPGCPHAAPTVSRLRELLRSIEVSANIVEVEVADKATAAALGFAGSPTVRINGQDVAGEPRHLSVPALACRLYSHGPNAGIPPMHLLRRALLAAHRREDP